VADVTTVTAEVFQINYRENIGAVRERFDRWLEEGLARALEVWRAGF